MGFLIGLGMLARPAVRDLEREGRAHVDLPRELARRRRHHRPVLLPVQGREAVERRARRRGRGAPVGRQRGDDRPQLSSATSGPSLPAATCSDRSPPGDVEAPRDHGDHEPEPADDRRSERRRDGFDCRSTEFANDRRWARGTRPRRRQHGQRSPTTPPPSASRSASRDDAAARRAPPSTIADDARRTASTIPPELASNWSFVHQSVEPPVSPNRRGAQTRSRPPATA